MAEDGLDCPSGYRSLAIATLSLRIPNGSWTNDFHLFLWLNYYMRKTGVQSARILRAAPRKNLKSLSLRLVWTSSTTLVPGTTVLESAVHLVERGLWSAILMGEALFVDWPAKS